MFDNVIGKSVDRRSFLRGSAVFAAALGLAVAPAFAQQQPPAAAGTREEGKARSEGSLRYRREAGRARKSSSTKKAGNIACVRSAATTCTKKAACGSVRTAATATLSKA